MTKREKKQEGTYTRGGFSLGLFLGTQIGGSDCS